MRALPETYIIDTGLRLKSKVRQNAESNENSSSKIEEVPVGRRSMIAQNKLTINTF